MSIVLIICAVLFTVAISVVTVFLVIMLIQARRTAHEAEALLKNLNEEMAVIKKITGVFSSIFGKFNSPIFKVASWVAALATMAFRKRNSEQEDNSKE
ncbi:MAG: hypothetical protein LHV68_00675 [Elusimicrobia bacterium]|nr:hypothetical protein [Candidatus Liberimonas magnetica]